MRGEVVVFKDDNKVHIKWDRGNKPILYYTLPCDFFIREFQPGDRVVCIKDARIDPGHLGTVHTNDAPEGFDFLVKWDAPHRGAMFHCYRYSDNNIAHAPSDTPPTARTTPILPPQPDTVPPPRINEPSPSRCYFCGRPDSEWIKDRPTCDDCMERYR